MTNKDVDFTTVSLPVDEFDAMMRRALDTPLPKATHPAEKEGTPSESNFEKNRNKPKISKADRKKDVG